MTFCQQAVEPIVEELSPAPDIEACFLRLSARPHCLFLDSAQRRETLGRYSFLCADPYDFWIGRVDESPGDFLLELKRRLGEFPVEMIADLPPFQGGAAGLFGYGLARQLERIPANRFEEFPVPELAIGFYDVAVAFDHLQNRAWIVSTGAPETAEAKRRDRAAKRLESIKRILESAPEKSPMPQSVASTVRSDELAPQFATGRLGESLTSNFSRDGYLAAVGRAIEYIHAGDVFQVNLSQRLLQPSDEPAVDLYRRLRTRNPAPFAGYFDLGDFQIASASPERFVQVAADGQVETRPIKGTRRRSEQAEASLFAGDDLLESEKDRAENVMIVDLLRNDLSRVCLPESVRVTQLCRLESYEFVQHLVSAVVARLRPEATAIDLLRAAFPGGSITGAPKVRAMEIIAELEPTARGAYCGSLGYAGFNGALDASILIRTITVGRGWRQLPVGGGVVAESDPLGEYEETWHKAEGLLRALENR